MLNDIATRRMRKEMLLLRKSPREGVQLSLDEDRLDQFSGAIMGPADTPYDGGIFQVKINIPVDFPFSPPEIIFLTKIFHPNVDPCGNVCLDILKRGPGGGWTPSLTLGVVLDSLRTLLSEPNPTDPLMPEIANLYINNQPRFMKTAKEWTIAHATQGGSPPPAKKRKI